MITKRFQCIELICCEYHIFMNKCCHSTNVFSLSLLLSHILPKHLPPPISKRMHILLQKHHLSPPRKSVLECDFITLLHSEASSLSISMQVPTHKFFKSSIQSVQLESTSSNLTTFTSTNTSYFSYFSFPYTFSLPSYPHLPTSFCTTSSSSSSSASYEYCLPHPSIHTQTFRTQLTHSITRSH